MIKISNIPKIIHYCWFGRSAKPNIIQKCINSWLFYLPDYEIIEWNESNFDINSNTYVREAYKAGKYAFVSDYVRVDALYKYGGIYLDTDVLVFKSFDNLLYHESFWGFEQENYIATSTIGAAKGNKLIKYFLESYNERNFINPNGTFDSTTNVAKITPLLFEFGLKPNGKYQEIEGVGTFYPQPFFSPFDYINYRKLITEDTYAMHLFYKSWLPPSVRIKGHMKWALAKLIGGDNILRIRYLLSKETKRP